MSDQFYKIGAASLALIIIICWYIFKPTIRTVSTPSFVNQYQGKPLSTFFPMHLMPGGLGRSHFHRSVLAAPGKFKEMPESEISPGTVIQIEKFTTYKHTGGSGITSLYAIGTINRNNTRTPFEYKWDDVDLSLNSEPSQRLPKAPWQSANEVTVVVKAELRG